jgi:hypothetical protein
MPRPPAANIAEALDRLQGAVGESRTQERPCTCWLGWADLSAQKKNERLVWWHEPLMVMEELVPRDLYDFAGVRLIWVSLRSDAALRPWAQLDVAAERPGVAARQLSARFLCAQEQPRVPASQLRV